MKRITAFILTFAILATFAACGTKPADEPYVEPEPEATTEETTLPETTTEELTTEETTVEETTEFVPKEWPPLAPVKSVSGFLPVKESDYEELERLLCNGLHFNLEVSDGFLFDCSAADAMERALDMMRGAQLYNYFVDTVWKSEQDASELQFQMRTSNGDELYYMPADRIDWILKYYYNVEPDHSIQTERWFYKDGYYCSKIALEGADSCMEYKVYAQKVNPNNTVDFSMILWELDYAKAGADWGFNQTDNPDYFVDTGEHFSLTAGIREIDGVRQWTIFRFEEKDVPSPY